jgi:integral membrane protein (TIGR01906 family)
LRYALILTLPVGFTLVNVRLLMTPAFPAIEYNLPDFPADPYGITKAQRLYWSNRSIDFIQGFERAGQIEQWKFPEDGVSPAGATAPGESCQYYGSAYGARDCTYFYNDREVKHMVDVLIVVRGAMTLLLGAALVALLAIGGLRANGSTAALRAGLLGGAGLTAVLYLALIAYIAVNFNTLFVQFHEVLFQGGTWSFLWSDSLIRLFPIKFWQDAFTFIGVASLLEAGGVAAWAWWGLR